MRRQSAAATALSVRRAGSLGSSLAKPIESGVALRLPPQSKPLRASVAHAVGERVRTVSDGATFGLISVGIRAKHLDEIAVLLQFFDRFRHFRFLGMPVAIDEEIVLPGFAFARA